MLHASRLASGGWVSQSIIGIQGNRPSRGISKKIAFKEYRPFELDVRIFSASRQKRNVWPDKQFRQKRCSVPLLSCLASISRADDLRRVWTHCPEYLEYPRLQQMQTLCALRIGSRRRGVWCFEIRASRSDTGCCKHFPVERRADARADFLPDLPSESGMLSIARNFVDAVCEAYVSSIARRRTRWSSSPARRSPTSFGTLIKIVPARRSKCIVTSSRTSSRSPSSIVGRTLRPGRRCRSCRRASRRIGGRGVPPHCAR